MSETYVYVDCFTYDSTTLLLTNQWQLVDASDALNLPVVIPSSNNL
jgi:hypothetical protein